MRVNKRPEIEGTPLDIVVLRLKQLQIKDLMAFPYLSRPPDENLKQSLETMQLIGCLDEKAEINEIGRTLVKIPIEPLLSRAIIDGIICDMLVKGKNITSKIIKVLAMIVNCSNVFYSSEDTKEICERSKFRDYA
jgi:HrpA-like RNA helicase